MTAEKNKIRRCFNRAKATYDRHCQLQLEVGHALIAKLNQCALQYPRILDLGCGTGLMTQSLENLYPNQELIAIDIAEDLLGIARRRLCLATQVVGADFDEISSRSHQFDLVFSNMALQWSINFVDTLREIRRVIKIGGYLAFSLPVAETFADTKRWLHQMTGKSCFNDFMLLPNIFLILAELGYQVVDHQLNEYVLKFENFREALQSIKNVGAMMRHDGDRLTQSMYCRIMNHKLSLKYQIAYFVVRLPYPGIAYVD